MKNSEADFKKALDYLYSFVDFSLQRADTYSSARFKLERMEELNLSLGNPSGEYPSIHVAGTKGKGSVCILSASAIQQGGYKVGLYTSPHLDDYTERIQINGEFIPQADLVRMVEILKPHVAAIPELTTFEITTALAFMYFAEQQVDAAIIEVGLGGRLDATNIIRPIVSIITSISLDHTQLLGDTLTQIAGEKAGIIKTGIPVISSPQDEEAYNVIEQVARHHGSHLIKVGRDVLFREISHSLDGQIIGVWSPDQDSDNPLILSIPLLGAHQAANAATAYAALQIFDKYGLRVDEDSIKSGFAKAFWPGRFEIIQHSPPVILDCAHNRDSALKLRLTIDEYYPGRQVILVFGASEDKDIQGMFTELLPYVKKMIAVKSFHPRAIDTDKLVGMTKSYGNPVICVEDIPAAVEKALELADDNALVLVTGSIFVVAEARKYFEKKVNIRRY
jgi:dihydrofolate synthase / folylpolyglutamate synthase